jgi:hypothetical protein
MKIGKRDQALLESMSRYGTLSTKQIRTRFFEGVAKTTVLRRLRILEESDVIRRIRGLPDAELAWIITKHGASQARVKGKPPKYNNQNAIRHEVQLTSTRMLLEQLGLGENFTPEFELKRLLAENDIHAAREKQVPDGLFLAEQNGVTKTVALELERTIKGWSRYKKVVTEYESKEKLDFVWYLTNDHRLEKLLMPLWKKRLTFRKSPELLLTYLYDLESNGSEATVHRSDHPDCKLNAIFDLKSEVTGAHITERNLNDYGYFDPAHRVSNSVVTGYEQEK